MAADLLLLPHFEQGHEVGVRLRVRGDLVAAADKLADVVPGEVLVIDADPVRDDAERAAPASLLQHGRRDEKVVLERIVEGQRHAERGGGCGSCRRRRKDEC